MYRFFNGKLQRTVIDYPNLKNTSKMTRHQYCIYLLAILTTLISCKEEKKEQSNTILNKVPLDSIKKPIVVNEAETVTEQKLTFKLTDLPNIQNFEDIDFKREKPKCEFNLKGKLPLKYCFYLENDTIASLYHFKNNKFQFQDTLDYQPFMWHIDNNMITSNFKIMDFDNDGDEDLLCWVFYNINGNEWTIIFINDQKQQKLVKLYNSADKTYIWDKPEFDKKTNTINTERYGSAYGSSEESSFKLHNDLTVAPLKKHYQDRYTDDIVDYEYIGRKGKWKLKSKRKYN